MNVTSLSVLICTYNRAGLLRETLASLQTLRPPRDCVVEIIVVDNNSTDDTPQVIFDAARSAQAFPLISLHESRQGKSFALNAGLCRANGDILALADDDVLPSPEWLHRIVEGFRARDVTFVFGKVLPRWERTPPAALLTIEAQSIWGPLALVDYGNQPLDYRADNVRQRLPIGANLAFWRAAIVQIGGWRTDLGKVDNSLISGEDHEIFLRLRRAGLYSGFYDPAAAVHHFVPAARVTRKYFRRWFYWHGKTQARMLDDVFPELDLAKIAYVAGVPRFTLRQALHQVGVCVHSRLFGDPLSAFIDELYLMRFLGLFAECYQQSKAGAAAAPADTLLSSPPPLRARIVKSR
jgi:glycosyltransferase involved in cell wall biosynthesis